jgi:hypothetical protein
MFHAMLFIPDYSYCYFGGFRLKFLKSNAGRGGKGMDRGGGGGSEGRPNSGGGGGGGSIWGLRELKLGRGGGGGGGGGGSMLNWLTCFSFSWMDLLIMLLAS